MHQECGCIVLICITIALQAVHQDANFLLASSAASCLTGPEPWAAPHKVMSCLLQQLHEAPTADL